MINDMRAKFLSIEDGAESSSVRLTLDISRKMWNILHCNGDTEFDIYRAEPMPRDFPLTEEIIKKAGFHLEEVGDNGAATPPQHRNRFEKWVAHTTWKDCVLWHDRRSGYYHIKGLEAAKLRSTQQLQKALNLIGMPIIIDE